MRETTLLCLVWPWLRSAFRMRAGVDSSNYQVIAARPSKWQSQACPGNKRTLSDLYTNHIYIYIHVHVSIYTYIYAHMHTYVNIHIYIHIYVYIYNDIHAYSYVLYIYAHIYAHIPKCMFAHTAYVYMGVCVYMCVCVCANCGLNLLFFPFLCAGNRSISPNC